MTDIVRYCPSNFPSGRTPLTAVLLAAAFLLVTALADAGAQPQPPLPDAPVRIAITTFSADDTDNRKWAERIAAVLTADLAGSQAFIPLESTALVQERISLNAKPRFADWRGTNARVVLVGHVASAVGGRLRLAFRLWDVPTGKQIIGAQYYAPQQHWRRLAHVAADAVYSRLTGDPGYFDTRIAFIERRYDTESAVTRLAVMDQDGMSLEYLTTGENAVSSPRFSPTAQQLLYVSEMNGEARLHLRDLQRGVSEVVGDFPDLIAAPGFAPDGHRIVMSLKRGGNANLYEMNLRTRAVRRLTETPAIDTQPSFAPSGRHIVFVSGRSGTRQLYVMRADGSGQRRISRGEGKYAEPVWSPQGDVIAFVKRVGGQAFIGLMKPDGSDETLLTGGAEIDGLSWAPNGRALVYSRFRPGDEGGSQLFTIAVNGKAERVLETPHGAADPSWSPPITAREAVRER
ncbi:MAG: Tol-Pal system beta propeller repeat protein TolB [Dichotomicrobium sp.]